MLINCTLILFHKETELRKTTFLLEFKLKETEKNFMFLLKRRYFAQSAQNTDVWKFVNIVAERK